MLFAKCMKKDVNTFCNDWKFAKSRRLSWPCSGESCLLKNSWKNLFEWWAMRKERGLCWESPASTSRLSEPGLEVMPAKFRSGPRRRRRAGPTTPVFNLEWLHYSWGQCRLLVAAASSLARPLSKAASILTRVFAVPIREQTSLLLFPRRLCSVDFSFLTQAEKLQFHKEPVILINVLPTRVCPSQNL